MSETRRDEDLPDSVLFACNLNAVRSPMALGLARYLFGKKIFFDSAGVRAGEMDPFVIAVMDEIGIDLEKHKPKSFDDLEDSSFDLVITLTPEAQHNAMELTRTMACDVEYWPTMDPTLMSGSREQILDAYRDVRDTLMQRIKERFSTGYTPSG
ncbi:arsenate reductase ArsC [Emcibacter sp. SYSU 3D8]|uniref:arsenate-mycothiol transferase ArsC n=1 Tax=Emcibacter sp. SYSU 3D8 TaxID=3133969 RepID=UPI0031FE5AA3